MKTTKSSLAVPFTLVVCAVSLAIALGQSARSDEQQQIEFLTGFYKDYLSRPRNGNDFHLQPGSFYSQQAEALLATNKLLCRTLSRGDEKCGYGACGDTFLSTHETAPDLTFEKSRFKAVRAGINIVDVSFNVWPQEGADFERKLRYMLVRDGAGWRVDDVLSDGDNGFTDQYSMRRELNAENERILDQARDVSAVLGWVFVYLSQADMLDRIERFVASPLQVCDKSGGCQAVAQNDVRLRQTLDVLHRAYYQSDSDDTTKWDLLFPKNPERPAEGTTVKMDALELTFQGKAWWITKIDLRALGRTIPVNGAGRRLLSSQSG